MNQKFEIGQHVYKWTGDYRGPGIVRGIAGLDNGKLRYLVGHAIAGGEGEFLHVYAEGNLREPTLHEQLSTMRRQRDDAAGQAAPEGATGTIGLECPGAVGVKPATNTELLDALATAHRQVDILMAMVITMDGTFMPTKSSLWPDIVKRVELLQKHEAAL
jgi:hypothetical protein